MAGNKPDGESYRLVTGKDVGRGSSKNKVVRLVTSFSRGFHCLEVYSLATHD